MVPRREGAVHRLLCDPERGQGQALHGQLGRIVNATERLLLQPADGVDVENHVVIFDLVCIRVRAMKVGLTACVMQWIGFLWPHIIRKPESCPAWQLLRC